MNLAIPGFIILAIFAVFWEFRDYQRVNNRKCAWTEEDKEKRERLYINCSSFPYENTVVWRKNLLMGILCGFMIYLILKKLQFKYLQPPGYMIFFIAIPIFLVFHIGEGIKSQYLYREIYNKVNEKYCMET
jgi:hypothetical protein